MATPTSNGLFRPALIVVDMQEDFCPPSGSMAVEGGRSIAPIINSLLALPGFVAKIGTQDFHPPSHISFASNHSPPNNKPCETFIDMKNPLSDGESKPQLLWPVHCVQDSQGAEIIPEIHADKLDLRVKKGMDERVEMYSAFADAFGNKCLLTKGVNVDIAVLLKAKNVTHVYVVGLAGDYCVKATAIDAAKEGFVVYLVEDGVKSVDPGQRWEDAKDEMLRENVQIVSLGGAEVARVRSMEVKP